MEERKSMGGALVDVFDAGVTLVKSEISTVVRRVTELAKAKGIGVVLLLAAAGPLILALVFLILWAFYLLIGWGLTRAGAAFVMALLSLGATAGLALFGLRKLTADVPSGEGRKTGKGKGKGRPYPGNDDELGLTDEQLGRYSTGGTAGSAGGAQRSSSGTGSTTVYSAATGPVGNRGGGQTTDDLNTSSTGPRTTGPDTARRGAHGREDPGANPPSFDDQAPDGRPVGAPSAYQISHENPRQYDSIETPRNAQLFAGTENRVVAERGGMATVRVEKGTTTVPVYEATPDGEPQMYSSGINKKLGLDEAETQVDAEQDNHHNDPNLVEPRPLRDAPGIRVTTDPTFKDEMRKGGAL